VKPTDNHQVESFPPQIAPDCGLLILGTVPSVRSLGAAPSYGHKHNLFWPFMGELFDAGPEPGVRGTHRAPAAPRHRYLGRARNAASAGAVSTAPSFPAAKLRTTSRLCSPRTPGIRRSRWNGGKAQQSFRRLIVPRLDAAAQRARITQPRPAVDDPGQRVDPARAEASNAGAN
jgi:hypothetical protein